MSGDLEAKCWGCTQTSVQKFCCKWTISNFSFCMGGIQKKITSPVFSFQANKKVAWCLKVYPYFQSMKSPNVVRFPQYQHREFKKFLLRDLLLSHQHCLLPHDQLTICCKVSIVGAFFSIPGQNMTPAIKDSRHVFSDDLGELWKSSFTECCLVVAGHEFRAHKAILAARSPVSRAMFEHEMQESLTNCIEINDLDPQVFKEMMGFIYTGKSPHFHSHSIVAGVLAASDKYGLEGLKVMCEKALSRNLSVENAAHTLILADLHSTEQLKTQAMAFIARHASEVSEISGWKSMVESHPHLLAKAFHSLASAQCFFGALSQTSKMILGAKLILLAPVFQQQSVLLPMTSD